MLLTAPTPAQAARLTPARIATVLTKAGRKRRIGIRVQEIMAAYAAPRLRQPDLVEQAMADQAIALIETVDTETSNIDTLATTLDKLFRKHPDRKIICSFAGLGPLTGARVLAEIGDDRTRFATARGLKAYAGSAPVTSASGKTISVTRRLQKNNRLLATGMLWAPAAILHPGPERDHYLDRRTKGDRHMPALRNLFNRMLGQLHHCLQHHEIFDESHAYPETAHLLYQPTTDSQTPILCGLAT